MLVLPAAHQLNIIKETKKSIKEQRRKLKEDAKLLAIAIKEGLDNYALTGRLKNKSNVQSDTDGIYTIPCGTFPNFQIYLAYSGNEISFGIYQDYKYYDYTEIQKAWFWHGLTDWERDLLNDIFFK